MVLAAEHLDLFLIVQNWFLCNVFPVYLGLRNPESKYTIQTSWVSPKFIEHSRHIIDNGTQAGGAIPVDFRMTRPNMDRANEE